MKLIDRIRIAFNVLVGKRTGASPVLNPRDAPELRQRRTRRQLSWGLGDPKQNSPNARDVEGGFKTAKEGRSPLREHPSEGCSESNIHGAPVEGRSP